MKEKSDEQIWKNIDPFWKRVEAIVNEVEHQIMDNKEVLLKLKD